MQYGSQILRIQAPLFLSLKQPTEYRAPSFWNRLKEWWNRKKLEKMMFDKKRMENQTDGSEI